jgi:hypothetical protein
MKSKKAQSAEWVARFSNYLFWDVDKSKLDIFKYSTYVIDRVLSHGLLSDWYLIKEIYGKETIRQVALQQRHLDKQALAFCAAYFNEPLTNLRCYNYAQSNPTHWNY